MRLWSSKGRECPKWSRKQIVLPVVVGWTRGWLTGLKVYRGLIAYHDQAFEMRPATSIQKSIAQYAEQSCRSCAWESVHKTHFVTKDVISVFCVSICRVMLATPASRWPKSSSQPDRHLLFLQALESMSTIPENVDKYFHAFFSSELGGVVTHPAFMQIPMVSQSALTLTCWTHYLLAGKLLISVQRYQSWT